MKLSDAFLLCVISSFILIASIPHGLPTPLDGGLVHVEFVTVSRRSLAWLAKPVLSQQLIGNIIWNKKMNQLTGNMTSSNCERKTRIVSWKFLDEAANHEWYTHEFLVNKISRQNKT